MTLGPFSSTALDLLGDLAKGAAQDSGAAAVQVPVISYSFILFLALLAFTAGLSLGCCCGYLCGHTGALPVLLELITLRAASDGGLKRRRQLHRD